uniref:Uncharacterized protein n=1 Tax=viral metagenome TaxID=1070528 RepID=A0A6H2A5R3_9ZZZZ
MKTRAGFVSNSSTASFLIMGVQLNLSISELAEKIRDGLFPDMQMDEDKGGWNIIDRFTEETPLSVVGLDGDPIIGKLLIYSHDDDYSVKELELTMTDLSKQAEETKEVLDKLGITDEVKIYSGTESC